MTSPRTPLMTLGQRIRHVQQSIDAMTLRERLLVFAAALMLMGGAWEAFLAAPLAAREAIASSKIVDTRERIDQIEESLALAAQGIGGGMSDNFDRLRDLRRRVEEGDESVRVFTSDLVDPAQMRFVLEDLIRRQQGLELVRASNLGARPLIDEQSPAAEETGPMLYRHGFQLELEGSYLDCLAYLEAVERLPWQIYWAGLNLETEEHPRIRITLEIHTLSLEEDWIGV